MEIQGFNIRVATKQLSIHIIYKVPNTSVISFTNELLHYYEEQYTNLKGRNIIAGDSNIYVDTQDDTETLLFTDFLDAMNLKNHTEFPKHKHQHAIDLILSDRESQIIETTKRGHMVSNHNFIHCTLNVKHHLPETGSIQHRKIKKIDDVKFRNLMQYTLDTYKINTLEQKVDHYNKTLTEWLQECAPLKIKQLKTSMKQLWFDDNIKFEIQIRRMEEHRWNKEPTEYNYMGFHYQRRYVTNIIRIVQNTNYRKLLEENKNDFKQIFNNANKLLFRNEPYPSHPQMT